MNAIQILKTDFRLPIDVATDHGHQTSWIRVMHQVSDLELTTDQYINETLRLTNIGRETIDEQTLRSTPHLPKYLFGYVVQTIVRAYADSTGPVDLAEVYAKSFQRAKKYIETHPWVFATGEDENASPRLDHNGNIQPKKGDKKVMAKKVYEENKGKNLTRKEMIELLVKEVGLTPAGASTYEYNLRTGIY